MSTKVSGFGGYWVIGPNSGSNINVNTIQHDAEYELDIEYINDDVTTSGSEGWVEGLPIIGKLNSATLRVPEDSSAYPEALGLSVGTILTVWFKRGASTVYDQIVDTIVKSSRITNNQQKARVREIVCEMGQFATDVTAPTE